MINDIIIGIINAFDVMLTHFDLFELLQDLTDKLDLYQTYMNEATPYLSGAYFIFGKPLIIYTVGLAATVFAIKFIGALVMIVGQFVP